MMNDPKNYMIQYTERSNKGCCNINDNIYSSVLKT